MLTVNIITIPHGAQRYPTVGDWQFDGDSYLTIRVSEMSDQRYEFLVALHELVEAYTAKVAGIKEADVDAFDIAYEAARQPGDTSEPGDDPACPVYRQHQFASAIERAVALEIGVSWNVYAEEVENL